MSDDTAGLMEGMVTRDQLEKELSCSRRTVIRFEAAGLPVLRIGKKRLYEVAKVREWLLNGGIRPAPTRRRAAAA
jgi:hypothetical protein